MKKIGFFTVILAFFAMIFVPITANKVMAASECVPTAIIGGGEVCDDGNGDSIWQVLNLVVTIISIGVGILGVVGITIVGIQYLTAGGSEEKTRKAKRRMFEIVLGLAVYAILFGITQWLGVGQDSSTSTDNSGTTVNNSTGSGKNDNSNTDADKDAKTEKKASASPKQRVVVVSSSASPRKTSGDVDENGTSANGRKVMKMAEVIAARMGKEGDIYYENNDYGISNWNDIKTKNRSHCAQYVSVVLQEAGLIPKNKIFCLGHGKAIDCNEYGKNGDWSLDTDDSFKASYYSPSRTIADLVENKKMVPGDIVGKGDGWHTMIYRGKKNGKYYFYSVGPQKKNGQLVPFTKDWIINRVYEGDYKIGNVYHPI